jgi:hypothetical protein
MCFTARPPIHVSAKPWTFGEFIAVAAHDAAGAICLASAN